jgi:hypothetical protein
VRSGLLSFIIVVSVLFSPTQESWGGKLAETGWARITGVTVHGAMQLHYASGKVDWKRLNPDKVRSDTRLAIKNLFKPARYVETKQGSTLTFPGGDTLLYYELK